MQNTVFINELKLKYKENNVIPFIGAGLSMPFNVPNWEKLIRDCALAMGMEDIDGTSFMNIIDVNLQRYDYWEAVASIKKYALRSEADIQAFVVNKVIASISQDDQEVDNNYYDLAKYNFNVFFTTNYDHLIQNYLDTPYVPVNLRDVSSNIQNLLAEKNSKRIFHLHGNISDESSIVLSKEKYEELYSNDTYKNLFSIFSGVKTFLFVGFSFNDVFIQSIIKENNQYFKSKHYIILANPTINERRILKEKYNIETIAYAPEVSSHQEEVRKILKLICEVELDETDNEKFNESMIELDDLPNVEEKDKLENNLFCKKLRIEDIGENKISYSKDCFFTAEQYFRWLKKSGIKDSEVIAEYMIKMTYMQYQKCYTSLFEENRNSNELWKAVHELLSSLDLNKLKKRINDENLPNDINKQGFIHILADDVTGEKEVWWGDKRFEE